MRDLGPLARPSFLLAVPVFVYASARAAAGVDAFSVAAGVGLVLALVPLLGAYPRYARDAFWLGPAAGIAVGLLGALPSDFAPGSFGMEVLGGFLLGAPFALVAALLRWGEDPARHLLLTFAGLVAVVGLLAASTASAPAGVGALTAAFYRANLTELVGIGALLTGASSATLPLQALSDGPAALFELLALVGVFLAVLGPGRSAERAEGGARPAYLGPVLVGVAAAAGFEVVAVRVPTAALLSAMTAVLGVLVMIVLLASWGPMAAAPARRASAAPPADTEGPKLRAPAPPPGWTAASPPR